MPKRKQDIFVDIPGFSDYRVNIKTNQVLNIRTGQLSVSNKDYYYQLKSKGRWYCISLASILLRAFVRPPRKGELALHWDDDKSNNDLSNLRWGTMSDNVKDAFRNGRMDGAKHAEIMKRIWATTDMRQNHSRRMKKAWAKGRYKNRTATRLKNNGGAY